MRLDEPRGPCQHQQQKDGDRKADAQPHASLQARAGIGVRLVEACQRIGETGKAGQ